MAKVKRKKWLLTINNYGTIQIDTRKDHRVSCHLTERVSRLISLKLENLDDDSKMINITEGFTFGAKNLGELEGLFA